MQKRMQYHRLLVLGGFLVLCFAGLGYRLVDLQVLRHEQLSARAQQNTQREFLLEPRRGDILDAKGNPLATSIFVKTICADPRLVGDRAPEIARAIGPLLQMPESDLVERLNFRYRKDPEGGLITNKCVVLKRKVSTETWEQIQQTMQDLTFDDIDEKQLPKPERRFYQHLRNSAIFADRFEDQLRVYPGQALAAHVLGYVGMHDRVIDGVTNCETAGKDGIELMLNSKLRGIRGWRVTETDRRQRELVTFREQDVQPRDGLNVVLTIDSVIQHVVESALAEAVEKHAPISISGIVVRPSTGEILAMATLPNFDPNRPGDFPTESRRNRVITDMAEPGSTFKAVIISGALNDKAVRLTDVFDCEHGRFFYGGRTLHDHGSYGPLTVEGIITKSSNIGAAKVGIRMGEERVYHYMREFGFGTRTGIPLPGEVAGLLHPVSKWYKVSLAQIPMGHYVGVTRLQMTMAFCAIGNGGWLMRPMLVDRLEDRDHHVVAKYSPQKVRQVISEEACRSMTQALKTVVGTNGTAHGAALEHYEVAGKTGTAQKVENGTYVAKYFSSFIGFLPADKPEVCISITLDEPTRKGYYGGQAAAPVFKQIAERLANYLNIPPKDNFTPDVPESLPVADQPVKTAVARSP